MHATNRNATTPDSDLVGSCTCTHETHEGATLGMSRISAAKPATELSDRTVPANIFLRQEPDDEEEDDEDHGNGPKRDDDDGDSDEGHSE